MNSVAKIFWMPDNYGEMNTLLKKYSSEKPIVIGNGSNVLFSTNGIEEPLIHTGQIKTIIFYDKDDTIPVKRNRNGKKQNSNSR